MSKKELFIGIVIGTFAPIVSSLLIKVVADIEMQSGQCILESDLGLIECSIDDQLDALRKAMTLCLTKEKIS